MKTKLLILTAATLLCSGIASAIDGPSANAALVQSVYTQQLASTAGNSNLLVRPGLIADRNLKKVSLQAEATGIRPGEPVEFYVISPKSGHAYEALAVSFAKPSDIHAALEFIGMKPGATVDYDKLRLWPKGERVFLTLQWEQGDGEVFRKRAELLLIDTDTGTTLPETGFCFTGSNVRDGKYDADENEPGSIASDFNDLNTVLDVPFKRDKSGVYRRFTANPEIPMPKGKLVTVDIEPEYKDSTLRVADMTLSFSAPEGASWKDSVCTVKMSGAETNASPEGIMDFLQSLIEQGRTPHLDLRLASDVPLGHAVEMCRFLDLLCTDNGIRIEPPAKGQLFYKAFLPQPEFRKREDRPSQPWEIHAGGTNGLKLVQIREVWPDDAPKPELKIEEYTVQDCAEALAVMREKGIGIPVLVIFAPDAEPYGELVKLAEALRIEFPTLYIFSGR
ncbi:MAG: YdjY domain-containing protein [Kiritimatiellia bacterium]